MRRAVSFLLLAAIAPLAHAQGEELKTRLRLGAETRHVYRGVERAGDGAFAGVDVGNGAWSAGAALHQPFGSGDPREINLGVGYAWQASEVFAVEFSGRHFWFGDAVGASIDRSLEAGVALVWKTPGGFVPRLAYYRDFELEADTVHASVSYEHALTKWGTFLELSVFAGCSRADNLRFAGNGAVARDGYAYFGGEARLPYRIGEITVVSLAASYGSTNGQSRVWSPAAKGGGDRVAVRLQVEWEL